MRNLNTKATTVLLLTAFYFPAAQAETLSLRTAIDHALQNSPRVQKAKSAAEEASWKRVEAFSTYLPTVQGQVSYLTNKRYALTDIQLAGSAAPMSIPQILPTSTYGVTAQYQLFDGFAGTERYLSSRSFERAAEQEFDWTKFQVEREVCLQFYRTLSGKILENVAEQNLKTLQDHLKDTHLFQKVGVSTNYDVLRVEVQVSEAQSEVLNTKDNSEVYRGRLAEMLGEETPSQVTGELPVLSADMIQKADLSKDHREDLIALQDRTEAANHLRKAGNRHWIPKVSAFGTWQAYNNRTDGFDDSSNYRESYQVGLNLTWNLFDGFAAEAKSRQAIEQAVQTEKGLQISRLKAKQDIDFWKRKYVYFCTVYKSRLGDIQRSEEALRLAREGRRVGARTNTDLLDTEAELYRARAGLINAQIGAIEALINLELATGQTLAQFN